MAILMTGAAGYIGSHTAYAFLEASEEVIVLDDLSTGFLSLIPKEATFYQGDFADENLLERIFEAHSIEAVVHFAASLKVEESTKNPELYYENNTSKTLKLWSFCRQKEVHHVIFSSTASVYGDQKSMTPVNELAKVSPKSPYAFSKLFSERMLQDIHEAHGLSHAILRYFNVAGADPKGRTGQLSDDATSLLKVASETAVNKREFINVFGNDYETQDGTTIRDYIHVWDLALAHLAVHQKLKKEPGKLSKIYNCGYGFGYSVKEVLDTFDEVLETPLKRIEAPRRAGDVGVVVADASKLQKETDWRPKHADLKLIVQSALRWEQKTIENLK